MKTDLSNQIAGEEKQTYFVTNHYALNHFSESLNELHFL